MLDDTGVIIAQACPGAGRVWSIREMESPPCGVADKIIFDLNRIVDIITFLDIIGYGMQS